MRSGTWDIEVKLLYHMADHEIQMSVGLVSLDLQDIWNVLGVCWRTVFFFEGAVLEDCKLEDLGFVGDALFYLEKPAS